MVYLMTVVDPDLTDLLNETPRMLNTDIAMSKVYKDDDVSSTLLLKDAFSDEVLFPASEGRISYGLEKASESDKLRQGVDEAKIIPLYRHLAAHGLLVNSSDVQEVVSPIKTPTELVQSEAVFINNMNMTLTTPIIASVKGFRRSVNYITETNENINLNSGVILQITDDTGHPRIEIKLESKRPLDKSKRYHRSSDNNLSFVRFDSDEVIENIIEDGKSTVIIILPNNTFIINKTKEQPYIQNYTKEDNSSISTSAITKNNRRNLSDFKEITNMMTNAKHNHKIMNENAKIYRNNSDIVHFDMSFHNGTKSIPT
ncbi:unnamed protein product [Diatraea saccharalis]|uniref:Uncharacterized protein n=1 Tax=Diatraea saccharalis TaxID=40085 RepID=A0A9N9WJ15_9NEOP|nr:unnamed protein product [Diatraea saccharalis]